MYVSVFEIYQYSQWLVCKVLCFASKVICLGMLVVVVRFNIYHISPRAKKLKEKILLDWLDFPTTQKCNEYNSPKVTCEHIKKPLATKTSRMIIGLEHNKIVKHKRNITCLIALSMWHRGPCGGMIRSLPSTPTPHESFHWCNQEEQESQKREGISQKRTAAFEKPRLWRQTGAFSSTGKLYRATASYKWGHAWYFWQAFHKSLMLFAQFHVPASSGR